MNFTSTLESGVDLLARAGRSGLTPEPDENGMFTENAQPYYDKQDAAPPSGEKMSEPEPIGHEDEKKDEEKAAALSPPPKRRKLNKKKIVVLEDGDKDDKDVKFAVPAAAPSPPKGKENEAELQRRPASKRKAALEAKAAMKGLF